MAEIKNSFKYRGFKISEIFNKKTKRREFKVRFQINNKEFYLTEEKRKNLEELIDETIYQERRAKYNLEVIPPPSPKLAELFEQYLPNIESEKHREFSNRVFKDFLKLTGEDFRLSDFTKEDFEKYADWRKTQINNQSKAKIQPSTINKEMYAIRAALKKTGVYYKELKNFIVPSVPRLKVKQRRRERLVDIENELNQILAELRQEKGWRQTNEQIEGRKRLADELEFRYQTGLRRKEVVKLTKQQYSAKDKSLRTVQRFKTGTVTTFIPLSERAARIIDSRLPNDSDYIFSPDGEVKNNNYYTLKKICEKLKINYGRFKSGGFVPHDLRHNFAVEIVENADIVTASALLGHSNIKQTSDYLHTNEQKLREAIQLREKRDNISEIVSIYKGVKRKQIKLKDFIKIVQNLR